MNDRIAQMALEAGLVDYVNEQGQLITDYGAINEELRNFARLVAEDCAGIADEMAGIYWDGDGASSAEQVSRDIRARYSKD